MVSKDILNFLISKKGVMLFGKIYKISIFELLLKAKLIQL